MQGTYKPPWYKKDLFQTLLISVTVGVATALIVRQIEQKIRRR